MRSGLTSRPFYASQFYSLLLTTLPLPLPSYSTTVDPIIPTPFILSNSYRFRSFREIVIFLFDLKKKVKIYPEVLAPPPSLSYLTNIPKSKRMISEILAKKAAWNVKLIPPSMKPFASEFMISSENIVKKEYDKLSTLKKIHLMRNMRANSTGGDTSSQQSSSPSTSLTPKPPSLGSKNLISSRLLVRRKKMINISNNQSNLSIIPSQQISEELLSKSDDISSNEMISAPSTAEQSDPHASLNSNHHDHPYEYSDTESESSIYSNDNGDDEDDDEGDGTDTKRVVTLSIDHMIPLRPSQPPPSFYKRRQNIAFTSSLSLSLSNISPLLDVQADTISGLDR